MLLKDVFDHLAYVSFSFLVAGGRTDQLWCGHNCIGFFLVHCLGEISEGTRWGLRETYELQDESQEIGLAPYSTGREGVPISSSNFA